MHLGPSSIEHLSLFEMADAAPPAGYVPPAQKGDYGAIAG